LGIGIEEQSKRLLVAFEQLLHQPSVLIKHVVAQPGSETWLAT
jgi:hypothetical protein